MLNTINSLDQTISSFEIAQITGKQHSHVMRDIRELNKVYENLHQSKIGQILKITELPNGATSIISCRERKYRSTHHCST